MSVSIKRLNSRDAQFSEDLDALLSWQTTNDPQLAATVAEIIGQIREHGDAALLDYTRRFDRLSAESMSELVIDREQLHAAKAAIADDQRQALEHAAARIRAYHEQQLSGDWTWHDEQGNRLGQQVRPLDRAGLYVPGGKASYPSSVLMNAIPAKVAGVEELVMVSPTPDGERNQMVMAAAAIAGVDRMIAIGGAQAIAALAYGTETVPAVDKIVGPGNQFVAAAKQQVYGQVGLDMIAGPSEILVICDGETDPDWIAMDLFSQAEHDEAAQSLLISPKSDFLDAVQASIERLLPEMEREPIIRASLNARGGMILVSDLDEAIAISNRIAPEHLELSVADAERYLPAIRHAGAIFLGRYTPEALGDYCAGPNHVLPTAGTARFSSPLGVYDFQKRSSVIECRSTASDLGRTASVLARGEALTAHARSAEMRFDGVEANKAEPAS